MLAAAAMGSVFASPPPSEMLAAIRAVARNNPGEWQPLPSVSLRIIIIVAHVCRLTLCSLCSCPFLALTATGLAEGNAWVAHESLNNKMMVIKFRAFIQYVMV